MFGNADVLFRGIEHRAALAAVEFAEAKTDLVRSLLLLCAGSVVLFLAGIALTLVVAAAFWDTPHRVAALAWLAGAEVLLAGGVLFWVRHRWSEWRALPATRSELEKDLRLIRSLLTKPPPS